MKKAETNYRENDKPFAKMTDEELLAEHRHFLVLRHAWNLKEKLSAAEKRAYNWCEIAMIACRSHMNKRSIDWRKDQTDFSLANYGTLLI